MSGIGLPELLIILAVLIFGIAIIGGVVMLVVSLARRR